MALQFRCADVGVECAGVIRADTEPDLLAAVAAHARDAHGVELNATLVDFARTRVRNDGGGRDE
jgi:predicted small metal-binding protein